MSNFLPSDPALVKLSHGKSVSRWWRLWFLASCFTLTGLGLPAIAQDQDMVMPPDLDPGPFLPLTPESRPLAEEESGEESGVILAPALEQTQPLPADSAPPPASTRASDLEETDALLLPEPFLGNLAPNDFSRPLQLDSWAPFPDFPLISLADSTVSFREWGTNLSPLQRPMFRLFGFETGRTLLNREIILRAGGNSFSNPFGSFVPGQEEERRRSNDIRLQLDYGITDNLQFTIGAVGKDDTLFQNLIAPDSNLLFIYQSAPAQLKWQVVNRERFQAALVLGAEFPYETVPVRADVLSLLSTVNESRKIGFSPDPNANDALVAEDLATFISLATPMTFQLTPRLGFHLNPQVSFFPESILVTNVEGSVATLRAANIGFVGDRLDYYGTVAGLGIGFDYDFSENLKFAADFTAVVSGRNSAGPTSENSLFVRRSVFNVGVQWAPTNRLGFNLYATNRFGPISAAPSNLLVQPAGSLGFGFDFMYLPDLGTEYQLTIREKYPTVAAFLSRPTGFPSTTLPARTIIYEGLFGSGGGQGIRLGLLDNVEFVAHLASADTGTRQLATEGGLYSRLALIPDLGERGLSASLTTGLLAFEGGDTATTVGLYTDFPLGVRFPRANVHFTFTPKFVVPTQSTGIRQILAVSLGVAWDLGPSTQLLAEYTPVLSGDNVLGPNPQRAVFDVQGRSALYRVGLRHIIERSNSAYALDVFVGNSLGSYGLQSLTKSFDQDSQFGVRLSLLNGIPTPFMPDSVATSGED